ncbi:hypothetical protein LCM28_22365, partial [Salipiger pacificus]|nr:hypothetical protein [Alloyangia pacifica]
MALKRRSTLRRILTVDLPMLAILAFTLGPYVCAGCCSQSRIWHDFGNRSYVSGLLIGSRAVALMGLRTR